MFLDGVLIDDIFQNESIYSIRLRTLEKLKEIAIENNIVIVTTQQTKRHMPDGGNT